MNERIMCYYFFSWYLIYCKFKYYEIIRIIRFLLKIKFIIKEIYSIIKNFWKENFRYKIYGLNFVYF